MIVPEGWPWILLPAGLGIVLLILGATWLGALALLGSAVALFTFRDPPRWCGEAPSVVASPADGRVVAVAAEPEATAVTIRRRLLDATVLRAPIGGPTQITPCGDGPLVAIRTLHGPVELHRDRRRQPLRLRLDTAGDRPEGIGDPGADRARGRRIGVIDGGGDLAVLLPPGSVPAVELGDRVRAGRTAIARLPHRPEFPPPSERPEERRPRASDGGERSRI